MARIDAKQGAELLGLTPSSFRRYRGLYAPGGKLPTFPPPDANGLWLPSALTRWDRTRPKKGAPGVPRPKAEYPCEACGEMRKRRIWDPDREIFVCRPCYVSGDPLAQEA